ncbi:MAG TPA: DinB family protein [Thermoanaerobaculia bacterium]|jgi:hypothetical protein|nr:DinB family protein [Thermoanaerobaculia bacterium]
MPELRPAASEYAPHHEGYVSLVEAPILPTLREQRERVREELLAIPEARGGERYQPGKWTVREVIGHLSDAERVYQFRASSIARGEKGPLPKYDPDAYVVAAEFDARTIASLVEEFLAVRDSTLELFANLPRSTWSRAAQFGSASVSVRGWAFIAAGHVTRHVNVLHERYGI